MRSREDCLGVINGDLDLVGVAQLLQTLSAADARGLLSIAREGQQKVLDFGPTGIRLVNGVRRTNPLGEILVRTGKIDSSELEALLAEQKSSGRRFGELVVERGIVTQDSIDFALREQVAEEIYDLFTWSQSTFEFDTDRRKIDGVPPGPLASVALDLNVMSLMIEAARRVDELQQIQAAIPDHRLVPSKIELPARLDDPSLDRSAVEEVLPLVDGVRSIGQIIESSFYPQFTVLRTLYGLSRQGVVKIRDQGEGEDDSQGPKTIIHRELRTADGAIKQGASVLVVSNLDTYRAALSFCMRTARCRSIEARNLDEVRDVLANQEPDVIILDTSIESESGLGLCRGIRAQTRIPLILLSDNGTRKAIVNALQSGAEYVLVKPFKEDVLMERIGQVLSGDRSPSVVPPPEEPKDHFLFG